MNPNQFFGELKRRNVYKVGVAYAVVAWLLMQIASQIFPFFEIPNWVVRLVILLLVIGFLDNPYQQGLGSLRPVAMQRTLELLEQERRIVGDSTQMPCDAHGRPRTARG